MERLKNKPLRQAVSVEMKSVEEEERIKVKKYVHEVGK